MKRLAVVAIVALAAAGAASTSSGTPGQSFVSFSAYKLDFGNCPVTTSCYRPITYTNTGDALLAEQPLSFPKPSSFGPTEETCTGFAFGLGLTSGGFCTVVLGFVPSEAKVYNGQVCFNFPDSSPAKVCVHLTGTGTA